MRSPLIRLASLALAAVLLAGFGTVTPAGAAPAIDLVLTSLDTPLRVTAPVGDDRLFVVERTGRIRVFDRDGGDRGVFLDWSDSISLGGERGLLGLAFGPDHGQTGRFYINYTDPAGDTRIARLLTDPANPDRALPGSAEIVIQVDQPYSNHNAGDLAFGPDGLLYLALGDGGSGGDPEDRAQNGQELLGKVLRLDVSGDGPGYAIPADNPFLGDPAVRDEIWALGLRNPWCYGFDRDTGDLYIADVGQNRYEEVSVVPAGSPGGLNLGWDIMEAFHCYEPPSDCDQTGLTLPVHAYAHGGGGGFRCSISGGFVHRGGTVPALAGLYLFADFCSNQVWSLDWTAEDGLGTVVEHTDQLTPAGGHDNIVSIGQDGRGDLYLVDMDGVIWRVVDDTTSADDPPAAATRMVGASPNPFNPQTELVVRLARDGRATVSVHDLAGRRLATVASGTFAAGEHRLPWRGRTDDGRALPSGVYLARLSTADAVSTEKITLAR